MIIHGDCLEALRGMEAGSVHAVVTDPPYYRVKNEAWDRQWDNPAKFIGWIGLLCAEWYRVLKPNGSLYVFASPQMAARVENEIGRRFNVLNHIVWRKPGGLWMKAEKEALRGYFPQTERIIFAEHYGADNIAKGEAGYKAKCDELRGFVFEPLREYLEGERRRAGIDKADCNAACGFARIPGGMASRHYFSPSQWCLPTETHYVALQELFNAQGHQPPPPWEDYHASPRERYEPTPSPVDYLRADYENLRADYDYLRRPFAVTAEDPYTDVWDFPNVQSYPGKHPCEKPVAMMEHIVRTSTRPGDTVLDCFMGTGAVGMACASLGREFIGIEREAEYVAIAEARIKYWGEQAHQLPLFEEAP